MKKKQRSKRGETLAVALLSILFLATAAFATAKYVFRAPDIAPDPLPDTPPQDLVGDAQQPDDTQTQPGEGESIPSVRTRREYCYTILVSGIDNGNGGSDTNILVRFDAKNKTIDCVSLPRDTLLNHQWVSNKLNFAYAKGGTELLKSEISNLLGIPVDKYVSVDLNGFIALVDAIDGVDFNIPVDMDYDDPYQGLSIHYKKGMHHLNGQQAMEVVRWRKNNDGTGYASADIGRIGTQQAFLKEVARQLLQVSNIKDIPELVGIFYAYVKTDLTTGNLVWLGTEALSMGLDKLRFHTLPGDGMAYYRKESVYALDPEATLALVNDALNPYETPITLEDMDILVP